MSTMPLTPASSSWRADTARQAQPRRQAPLLQAHPLPRVLQTRHAPAQLSLFLRPGLAAR